MAISSDALGDSALGELALASGGDGPAAPPPEPVVYEEVVDEFLDLAIIVSDEGGTVVGQTVDNVERAGLLDYITATLAYGRLAAEEVGLSDPLTAREALVLREQLRISEALAAPGIYDIATGETVLFAAGVVTGFNAQLVETVTLTELDAAVVAVQLSETVAILGVVTGQSLRGVLVQERLGLSDNLLRQVSAEVAELLGLGVSTDVAARAVATLLEDLLLAETLTPQLRMRVLLRDEVDVAADETLRMLYSGKLVEGVELSGGYVSSAGDYTAWAMNTTTGAVSEYTNFAFNSFARFGNRYVGASAQGLFELLGDDDDGEDIVAVMRGGYMQFGGVQMSRLKAAYLAVRGDGDFVLRIETAEGATYDYGVAARNMRTTKVHMGKGQRARYFTYELTSQGQDFDLESLEFVPLVVQRRV